MPRKYKVKCITHQRTRNGKMHIKRTCASISYNKKKKRGRIGRERAQRRAARRAALAVSLKRRNRNHRAVPGYGLSHRLTWGDLVLAKNAKGWLPRKMAGRGLEGKVWGKKRRIRAGPISALGMRGLSSPLSALRSPFIMKGQGGLPRHQFQDLM